MGKQGVYTEFWWETS